MKEYVGIRQATRGGYIECEVGGVADFLYPTSKHRRGRVQGKGQICPTITAENTGVCKVEKVGNLYEKNGQAGNIYDGEGTMPCLPGFGGGGGGKEFKFTCKALNEQNMSIRQETFGTIVTDGSSPIHNNRVVEKADWENCEYRIRKLTARECGRLMDVKDKHIDKVLEVNSNTQAYKQFGNSIVVSVLCAIFSQLNMQGVKPWNERTLKEKYDLVANPKAHIE